MNVRVGHPPACTGRVLLAADGRVGFCGFSVGQSCCPAFCFRFLGKGIAVGERIGGWGQAPFLCVRYPPTVPKTASGICCSAKARWCWCLMANFGHPITRTFASRYANTYGSLRDGGFAAGGAAPPRRQALTQHWPQYPALPPAV